MTRRPDDGDEYYRRVAADDLAIVVKLADIWDNTDPDRVARLDPQDRTRPQDKYRHALEVMAASAPQVDPWTVTLRDVVVNGIHSHLLARRQQDGTVCFEAQDLGVPTGLVSNDTEYEYFRTVLSLKNSTVVVSQIACTVCPARVVAM